MWKNFAVSLLPIILIFLPEIYQFCRRLMTEMMQANKIANLVNKSHLTTQADKSFLKAMIKNLDESWSQTLIWRMWRKFQNKYQVPDDLTPTTILFMSVGLAVVAFNLAQAFGMSFWSLLGLFWFGEIIGLFWLITRSKKLVAFIQEFPESLLALAKIYRAYPDLGHAIQQTSQNSLLTSTKDFFQQVAQRIKIGVPPIHALEQVSQKFPIPALAFVIRASQASLTWGGDLASLYERFAAAERQTAHARRQMASIMFQNKVSAVIAAVMVPLVWLLSMAFSTNYRQVVTSDQTARGFIIGAFVWWAIGVVMVWRVMKVK